MLNNSAPVKSSNAELRQKKRQLRQQLSNTIQHKHSQLLCQNTIKLRHYRNAKHIALYLANDGEIDPATLVEHARFLQKKIYLPILSPIKNSLYFAPFETNSQWKSNRFDIPEPICHPSKWKTAQQMDLLLLPLVAFDTQGNRMGMGGGFYDRTLAYRQHRNFWKKPILMGLAHETQKVDSLTSQNWDIPLDFIITEKQTYKT